MKEPIHSLGKSSVLFILLLTKKGQIRTLKIQLGLIKISIFCTETKYSEWIILRSFSVLRTMKQSNQDAAKVPSIVWQLKLALLCTIFAL